MKESGFSLASLFFLTTLAAIFAGGLQMAVAGANPVETSVLVSAGIFGSATGALVGAVVGVRADLSTSATILAIAVGAAVGGPSLILTAAVGSFAVMLIGSAVLLVFVFVVRMLSSRPSDEEGS